MKRLYVKKLCERWIKMVCDNVACGKVMCVCVEEGVWQRCV